MHSGHTDKAGFTSSIYYGYIALFTVIVDDIVNDSAIYIGEPDLYSAKVRSPLVPGSES